MIESMTLSDGRSLGFRCLGDPAGSPLFFFHGTPGSRLVFSETDPIAQIPRIRLITPERPGYGLSDPKPQRTLLDWADDVAELADHLGIHTFAVLSESGGGPHALACASRLADRVTMTLLLCSPAPAGFPGATRGMSLGNRLGILLDRYAPWLVRRVLRSYASAFEHDPEFFVDQIARQMAPPDQALMSNEPLRQAFIRDLREAYRQGSDGQAVDASIALTSKGWGFDLGQIAVPVHMWHGVEDTLVSMPMAQCLAAVIPSCQAHFVPGAGHLLTEHPEVMNAVRRIVSQQPTGDASINQ